MKTVNEGLKEQTVTTNKINTIITKDIKIKIISTKQSTIKPGGNLLNDWPIN